MNLGHKVGRGTIAKILKEAGIDPAPERKRRSNWKEFLRTHWDVLAATDFLYCRSVDGRRSGALSRTIRDPNGHSRGADCRDYPEPNGQWMKQVARNLTDAFEGFLIGCRYLIHDRSSLFTPEFSSILETVGIEAIRLPARSPNLNAVAERFVRSTKESCLGQLILIGESSLHRAVEQFVLHYHQERNHQSLGNKIIKPVRF